MSFNVSWKMSGEMAIVEMAGELDASSARLLKEVVEVAVAKVPRRLMLEMSALTYMASAGLRVLIFAKQKLGPAAELVVVGVRGGVLQTLELTGFLQSVVLLDSSLEAERRQMA